MMDCTDITRFLHAYIDQEFEHREEVEFEHHLMHCDSCRQEVAYYRALRRTLRDQVEREVAPVKLEASILAALDAEENSASMGWFSLSLATAGAVLCALGIFLWAPAVQDVTTARYSSPAPSVAHSQAASTAGTQDNDRESAEQSSAVVAPLSVRHTVPTRRANFSVTHAAAARRRLHQRGHVLSKASLGVDDHQRHAAHAILSIQQPKRCVERARRGGWFVPAGLTNQNWRAHSAVKGVVHASNTHGLDDLCDPPRRRFFRQR